MKLDVHKQLEAKMTKTIDALKHEYTTIRAGRANAQMLDKVRVDYYGSLTPINQMAAISVPEPRTLMINPWDKSSMAEIEKAIRNSDLGLNPTNDGQVIRISVPALTEERRKELAKRVHKVAEEFKVRLRNERRDANDALKKMEKDGELTEDELKKAQDEVQKITDKFIKEVDQVATAKEKDGGIILNKYYNLLGLQLEEVEKYLKEKNITYTVKSIQGKKDTDKLIIPKVIKISELDNGVELLTTKFSDSLK